MTNSRDQIVLYGIGGPEKEYAVLGYFQIFELHDVVSTVRREAARLVANNPSIKAVYMIDNRYGLRRDYRESVRHNSIESYAVFKDILEREGMRILL